MDYKTEQELFWAGGFGNEYIERNSGELIIASNTNFFSEIFRKTKDVKSIIEYGSNIGLNLISIKQLMPNVELSAVEINTEAANQLRNLGIAKVYEESILEFEADYKRDLVFTKTVLIHINPDELPTIYDLLYHSSNKYILICEYYNPTPVEIIYREHTGKLFKRDFAGEMMSRFKDLELLSYGFNYHNDSNFPQDDITWFLLKKC